VVPLESYLSPYDHGAFWCSTMTGAIIQGLCVPASKLGDLVKSPTEELYIWPLWLCPMSPESGCGIFKLSPAFDTTLPSVYDHVATDALWQPRFVHFPLAAMV
jgi:hypothetical protein